MRAFGTKLQIAALSLTLGACAGMQRPQLQPVDSQVVAVSGFRLDRPAALMEPQGLRFHGWICRRSLGMAAPRGLRVERLNTAGEVTATATRAVAVPHRRDCALYDVPTNWSLGPGETVRLCANSGPTCTPAR